MLPPPPPAVLCIFPNRLPFRKDFDVMYSHNRLVQLFRPSARLTLTSSVLVCISQQSARSIALSSTALCVRQLCIHVDQLTPVTRAMRFAFARALRAWLSLTMLDIDVGDSQSFIH